MTSVITKPKKRKSEIPIPLQIKEKNITPEFIKIISFNVNGLRAKLKNENFIKNILKLEPDIICFQETKTQEAVLELEGYYGYWNHSTSIKGFHGTAIFTKILPIKAIKKLGKKKHDTEGRMIGLEYENFWLINTYVPNSGRKLERLEYRTKSWDIDLRKFLIEKSKEKDVIWTGDLNVSILEIDVHNPSKLRNSAGFTNEERNSFKKTLKKTGFIDSFRYFYPELKEQYTYWSYQRQARKKNLGWRLDYFIVSNINKVKEIKILKEILGSDHCPIILTLKY